MRKRVGIYISIIAFFTAACTKEPLPELPASNGPIYTLNGTLGGEELVMSLGVGDVTVNYGIDELNGMETYYGIMESNNSGEKFKIEFIRQEKPLSGQGYTVFLNENIPFLVHEKGRIQFDFGGVGNQNNFLMLKDKNGNFVSTDILEISEFGNVEMSAIIYDYGNSAFDFNIKHGYVEQNLISRYSIEGGQNIITLQAESENYMDEWYIDGVLVGVDNVFSGSIHDGVHLIEHHVTDTDGNTSFTNGLVRFKGGKRFWNMEANYLPEVAFEPYNYGRVVVSVFKNEEWYRSDIAVSNKNTEMNVSNVSVIPNESKGKPLVGFDLDFSAQLVNQSHTDSISVDDIQGRFCVGLK